jgi:hypothetical protein
MNERIKELAIEAGGGPSKWYTDPDVLEYFAELVIRECGNYMNSRIPGNLEVSATVAKMKQHLGVDQIENEEWEKQTAFFLSLLEARNDHTK